MASSAGMTSVGFYSKKSNINLLSASALDYSKTATSSSYKNGMDYEEIDYSVAFTSADQSSDIEKKENTENEENTVEPFMTKDEWKDTFYNTFLWQSLKWAFGDAAKVVLENAPGWVSILSVATMEGMYKNALGDASGDELSFSTFVSGFTKSFAKEAPKEFIKKFQNTATVNLVARLNKSISAESLNKLIKIVGTEGIKQTFPKIVQAVVPIVDVGFYVGIDFGASLVADFAKGLSQGKTPKQAWDDINFGERFLTSTTKGIFTVAGTMIGTAIGGKTGGKIGKIIGVVVGSIFADVQVEFFEGNNNWCAAAAGAELIGGVVAVAIVANLWHPGGWVLGLTLIAGAAAGFAITAIAYGLSKVDWVGIGQTIKAAGTAALNTIKAVGEKALEVACEAVGVAADWIYGTAVSIVNDFNEAMDTAGEWLESQVKTAVEYIDYVETKVEQAVDYVETKVEQAVDYVETKVEQAVDYVEDKYNQAVDYVEAKVKANPVTNCLFGWAF